MKATIIQWPESQRCAACEYGYLIIEKDDDDFIHPSYACPEKRCPYKQKEKIEPHVPDLPTSYACEIIWHLVVDHSFILAQILDDMDEDCHEEILRFIRKSYEDDDPDLKRAADKLASIDHGCTLCHSDPCQCKTIYSPNAG